MNDWNRIIGRESKKRVPVMLQRDPFARADLMREVARFYGQVGWPQRNTDTDTRPGCKWCGQRSARGLLFYYWWETDSIYPKVHMGRRNAFCSVGCARTYGAV